MLAPLNNVETSYDRVEYCWRERVHNPLAVGEALLGELRGANRGQRVERIVVFVLSDDGPSRRRKQVRNAVRTAGDCAPPLLFGSARKVDKVNAQSVRGV